jgi:hypothetical protein
MNNNSLPQSNSQGTEMNKYDDEMIRGLFDNFIAEGHKASVTGFKKHLNELIDSHIKHLTTRSGKTGEGEAVWRRDVKAKFSGTGAKWVFVSLQEISLTITELQSQGIDCSDYITNTEAKGAAWIRFSAPRVSNGKNCAAFEVRTGGSKLDHTKQLHYIAIDVLDEAIRPMNKTPHALGLESSSSAKAESEDVKPEDVKPEPKEKSAVTRADVVIGPNVKETDSDPFEELNEAPTSDNPEEWEAFLAAEGLADPDLEDNSDDELNDDIF